MPEEPKIWYLLDALASAGLYYKTKGLTHGDIQPKTIHITPGREVILIDNMLLHPTGRDLLSKVLYNPAYRGPLSPSQLTAFTNKQKEAKNSAFSSEVWAIGLTALCYAVGGDVLAFYDWSKKEFKEKVLVVELDRLTKMGYSDSLVAVFKCLLTQAEENRPSIEELHGCLSKTEQKNISDVYPRAPMQMAVSTIVEVRNHKEEHSAAVSAPPLMEELGSPVRTRDPAQFATEQHKVE